MIRSDRSLITLLAALCALCTPAAPLFAAYQFINVADTTSNFITFEPNPVLGTGSAVFRAQISGGIGIFFGSGGPVTTVAKIGDPAPSGTFTTLDSPSKSTEIAFRGFFPGGNGIFRGAGGPLTTIAKTGDPAPVQIFPGGGNATFTGFGGTSMDPYAAYTFPNPNIVAFGAGYTGGSGIFLGNGGPLTTVAKTGDAVQPGTLFSGFGVPSLNAQPGTPTSVAFRGVYSTGSGIFTKTGPVLTTIATTASLGVTSFGDPVSLGNDIAFRTNPGIANEAVYRKYSGGLEPLAQAGQAAPSGTFTSFGTPGIAFLGYVFEGTYAGGTAKGIFARPGFSDGFLGPLETILKTGDPLFGSTVTSLSVTGFGVQSSVMGLEATGVGDIAFRYNLANGRQGVGLIMALPEPASALLILIGIFLAPSKRCRN